jgi:hexosaminidase
MVRHRGILAVVVIAIHCGNSPSYGGNSGPGIIPTPREWQQNSSHFRITAQTRVVLGTGTGGDDDSALRLILEELGILKSISPRVVHEESLRKFSDKFIYIGSPTSPTGREFLHNRSIRFLPIMREEGYYLEADSLGVIILAETPRGRFYGVMSLIQLFTPVKKRVEVRGIRIRDWPQMKIRGITDDLSRMQIPTIENFKRTIRFLARYKLNTYGLNINDVFAFANYPRTGLWRGFLTAEEIKEIDRFARAHHVELLPILQTVNRWEHILSLSQYEQLAEFPGAGTLNLADERIYTLLDDMIRQIALTFSSPHIYLGDYEIGQQESAGTTIPVNRNESAPALLNHYKRLLALVKKYRKKPMANSELLLASPALASSLLNGLAVDRRDGNRFGSSPAGLFQEFKIPFLVSSTLSTSENPLPDYLAAVATLSAVAEQGVHEGAIGLFTAFSGNGRGGTLRAVNCYGYAWNSECSWTKKPADLQAFNETFFRDFLKNEEAAAAAQIVYALLGINRVSTRELWQHPFVATGAAPGRLQSIETTIPLVYRLLASIQQQALRNNDHCEHLRFAADLTFWFAQKAMVAERIRLLQQHSSGVKKDSLARTAAGWCGALIEQLDLLTKVFTTLWLRSNRPEGLDLALRPLQRQMEFWREKREELEHGELWSEPALASKWIFHPGGNPFSRDTTVQQIPRARFRKEVFLSSSPERGIVQLLALTHATLWVNDTRVGELPAQPSPLATFEERSIGFWDITGLLKQGSNQFLVESRVYRSGESAGMNLCGEIETRDSLITLRSDDGWMVSENLRDGKWQQAVSWSYPAIIIRPNFKTGRPSSIEQ